MARNNAFSEFILDVEKGMAGLNETIPIGFPRLEQEIGGVGKSVSILFGGGTGTGKSSVVDTAYILNPYEYLRKSKGTIFESKKRIRVILRSMERNRKFRVAKWVVQRLYLEKGILLGTNQVLGKIKGRGINEEIYNKILLYTDYFDELLDNVQLMDGAATPKRVQSYIERLMLDKGTLIIGTDTEIEVDNKVVKKFTMEHYDYNEHRERQYFEVINLKGIEKKVYQESKEFIEFDEDLIVMQITDNLSNLVKEGKNNKNVVDEHVGNSAYNRDVYKMMCIDVSQFNREITDQARLSSKDGVAPRLEDFKESGNPGEIADLVIALFNPNRYKLPTHIGYNVNKLIVPGTGHNRFRGMHVLKNTNGGDDIAIGCEFLGEVGWIGELPNPMIELEYKRILAK